MDQLTPIQRLNRHWQDHPSGRWRDRKTRVEQAILTPEELRELGTIKSPTERLSRARAIVAQRTI